MTSVRIRIFRSLLKLTALMNFICSIVTSDSTPNGTPNNTPNNNNALQPFGGSVGGFPSLGGGFPGFGGQGGGFPGFGGQGGGLPSSSNNPSFPGQSPNPFFGGFPGFANQSPATDLHSPSQPATTAATTLSGPGAKGSNGLMKRDTFGSAEPTTTSTQSDPFGIKALLESIKSSSSSSSSASQSQPSSSFVQTREIATPTTTSDGITDTTTTTTTTAMEPTTTRTKTTTVTETNLPPISGESKMDKNALLALFLLLLLCLW